MSPSERDQLVVGGDHCYMPLPESASASLKNSAFRNGIETASSSPIFDDLPQATIVSVSRPDASDITPLLLSYTIDFQYKEFKWCLRKKASQVVHLHLSLKKRAIIEEFHEKQEQVKEWLLHLGISDHATVMHDDDDFDDEAVRYSNEGSSRHRYVPSSAALPIIRPALGGPQAIADKAKIAMQEYLNHFLGSLDIVNSPEVCKFLEASRLSFLREYGPKLKEDYVMVRHLPQITSKDDDDRQCLPCQLFGWCNSSWQKVWAVLKPGFLAFLEDPFDTKPLDIIIFDILPAPSKSSNEKVHLAVEIKERNPLHYTFQVSSCGQSTRLRTSSTAKIKDWVSAINDAAQRPVEGWSHPHRFNSFAPERGLTLDGSEVQWFIDGRSAFESIALSIENAKSEIFITGWWLCPELYLRRPFHDNESSRLDTLLEAKAKEGVQIYILLYKEVSIALKINSSHSKRLLLDIHENVHVLRYPDHFPGILYWSHHDKIIVVDYQICFTGGLDLCFGRYDTVEHKVGDCPSSIWPGKDYYNPRESEPNSWQNMMKDELDREKNPRMPWHDVHCALWGPPCRDIARHFVQRWNHAKRAKAPNQPAIPLLIPHQYKALPNHRVLPHYMGRIQEMDTPFNVEPLQQKRISRQDSCPYSPLQNIPLLLPQDSQRFDDPDGPNTNNNYHDQQDKNWSFSFRGSKVEPKAQDSSTQGAIEWWESQRRDCQGNLMKEIPEVGPRTSCNCQLVRSVAPWSAGTSQAEDSIHSAYCSLIQNAEHFIYIENQFIISGLNEDTTIRNRVMEAIYKRILRAHREKKTFRVIVVIPLMPGFQGGVDDGGAATVRALMHWQYRAICRGENSILSRLNRILKSKADNYISFYGLRTHGALFEGGPIVTSQIYVHSKLMIIDDRIALIGSSNINDRSLLGSRDSEIGVIIEDKEFVESSMDGKPWMVGKFTFSLRASLWLEHLGLHAGEISQICDPVADKTYKDLWMETAKTNTVTYQDVFSCVPNDDIHSRAALRLKMAQLKERIGYTTIDFGVAPKFLETCEDGKIHKTDPAEKLKSIRGFIVSFPLEFMREENLRPMFHEGEFYTAEVFH